MGFLSISFLVFWAVFALLYFAAPRRLQTYLLLAGNLAFYMWTNLANGVLLMLSITVGYFCARAMEKRHHAKYFLALGQLASLGVLVVFKYTDFLFGCVGLPAVGLAELQPIGISFYTFAMSAYLFDVYRGKLEAERNYVTFAAFVSFFPAILSGPICQARNLLPQLRQKHRPNAENIKAGILRFVLGCFKKVVLADGVGLLVNSVYAKPDAFGGGMWLIAVAAYNFQIYWDFSAYSDMAIGVGRLLGFQMPENFDLPYFSTSVKEFWKKWHISLTSWFREYLYFPLGGSRVSRARCCCNILIVFAVSGLWHGTASTFLVWGLINGLYQAIGQLSLPLRERLYGALHLRRDAVAARLWQTLLTFALVNAAWIFFRAASLEQALWIPRRILLIFRDGLGVFDLGALGLDSRSIAPPFVLGGLYTCFELWQKHRKNRLDLSRTTARYTAVVLLLLALISIFGTYGAGFDPQSFIYFKF